MTQLQPDDIDPETLLQAASNPLEEVVIRLLCDGGMRAAEVGQFTPDQFDPDADLIEIPPVKTGNPILVELPAQDSYALRRSLNTVAAHQFPISTEKVHMSVSRVAERTDQPDVHPNDLRRCYFAQQETGFDKTKYRSWAVQPTVLIDSIGDLREAIDEYLKQHQGSLSMTAQRHQRAVLNRFLDSIHLMPSVSEPFTIQRAAAEFVTANKEVLHPNTRDQYLHQLRSFERWLTQQQDEPLHRFGGVNQ